MRRLEDGWFEAETLCGAGAVFRFRIAEDLAPCAARTRLWRRCRVTDPGRASYRRTCDRPGCDSRPRETRQGKNPEDRRQSERTGGSLVCARCPRGSAYREGDFLFESVEGVYSKNRGEHGPVIAKASLIESVSAEEALRRFGGLRPARSARRSRPSPRPLHRARPKGRRSRPPGLPPSGSGSLSTCP
jgi:hypothetical protein